MKTRDFAATMAAFAELAEIGQANELRRFADIFRSGKEETIVARLKKLSRPTGHPANLRANLEAIRTGLKAAGAAKQATSIAAVLGIFSGKGDGTVDTFLEQITIPPASKKRVAPPPPEPDHRLARELADALTSVVLDTSAFNEIVRRLRATKLVNTPTLAVVANHFLGNSKPYTGRKAAIDDIVTRQKADARENARGRALNRLGV